MGLTLLKSVYLMRKEKLVDHVQRLTLLPMLFPNNSLQERQSNFFEFYLSHGEDLLRLLFEQLDPLSWSLAGLNYRIIVENLLIGSFPS